MEFTAFFNLFLLTRMCLVIKSISLYLNFYLGCLFQAATIEIKNIIWVFWAARYTTKTEVVLFLTLFLFTHMCLNIIKFLVKKNQIYCIFQTVTTEIEIISCKFSISKMQELNITVFVDTKSEQTSLLRHYRRNIAHGYTS